MQKVLALVEQRKQQFAQLPLFVHLENQTLSPHERLSWTPYLAPLSLGFGDLWKDILRRSANSENPLQQLINHHTKEDENHWKWFIGDIEKLGFLRELDFTQTLQMLWNAKTPKTRQVCLKIAGLTYQAEPEIVLAAIEALEATANVVFTRTAKVVEELPSEARSGLRYFSHVHLVEDDAHAMFDSERHTVESIELTLEQELQAMETVEEIFQCFEAAFQEIMSQVEPHSVQSVPVLVA